MTFLNFFFTNFWHFVGLIIVVALLTDAAVSIFHNFAVAKNRRLGREAEIVRALESAYWLVLSVKEAPELSARIQGEAIVARGDIEFVLPRDRIARINRRRRQWLLPDSAFTHDIGVDKPSPDK